MWPSKKENPIKKHRFPLESSELTRKWKPREMTNIFRILFIKLVRVKFPFRLLFFSLFDGTSFLYLIKTAYGQGYMCVLCVRVCTKRTKFHVVPVWTDAHSCGVPTSVIRVSLSIRILSGVLSFKAVSNVEERRETFFCDSQKRGKNNTRERARESEERTEKHELAFSHVSFTFLRLYLIHFSPQEGKHSMKKKCST